MQDLRYIYAVARVRVLEKHLLKKDTLLNMASADTAQAALRIATETGGYPAGLLNVRDSQDIFPFVNLETQKLEKLAGELFLDLFLSEAFCLLRKDLSRAYLLVTQAKSEFLRDLLRRFIDLQNIKTILRMKYQHRKIESANLIAKGFILPEDLIVLSERDNFGIYQDLIKSALAKIEENNDFSCLEAEIESYILGLLRPTKYLAFGPEPIFSYCLHKANELKLLRLILLAKFNKIPNSEIQRRLALNYA